MSQINEMISQARIDALRASYESPAGRAAMEASFRDVLPTLYDKSGPYVDVIFDLFYGALPPDTKTNRSQLSEQDRERVIIALLAEEKGELTLSLHIYIGLMVGLSPEEMANILLLAGVYVGVNRFASGMLVAATTLKILAEVPQLDPKSVTDALKARFPS
jgi:alkylhydroperoxidase/carboxymuconolactone decarboxylase family protein YurZ